MEREREDDPGNVRKDKTVQDLIVSSLHVQKYPAEVKLNKSSMTLMFKLFSKNMLQHLL